MIINSILSWHDGLELENSSSDSGHPTKIALVCRKTSFSLNFFFFSETNCP